MMHILSGLQVSLDNYSGLLSAFPMAILAVVDDAPAFPPVSSVGDGSLWLPPPVTTNAASVDTPFFILLALSVIVLLALTSTLVYFFIVYRRKSPDQSAGSSSNSTPLIAITAGATLFVVFDLFYLGLQGYVDLSSPPSSALPVSVGAKKWEWSFTYPNGHVDPVLHVPVNRPVALQLESSDVMHGFSVPAFRLKKSLAPGQVTKAWFEANQPGEYLAVNSEYSGEDHAKMFTKVIVHEPDGFESWLNQATDPFRTRTPLQVGELLFTKLACNSCHSIDGSSMSGPSLKGLLGRESRLVGGKSVMVDENYIISSINTPHADVVDGYTPVMPVFQGLIKERELQALVEYLKTLK